MMMFNLFGSHNELNLEPKDLKARLDRGDKLVLLDVREPWEVKINRLDGYVHIPLAELPARFNEIDPKAEVVCYCQAGVRSLKAALFLKKQGVEKVWNLAGGIDLWAVEVDPSMPRYR
jgi:rhodanese-related sulfurtransferase